MFTSCKKADKLNVVYTKTGLGLSGAQEVPANPTQARGIMAVSYNKNLKVLTFNIDYTGLTGAPIGSHIHGTAPEGVNAPIKFDFTQFIPKTTSGNVQRAVYVDGITIKEDSLLAGYYYINIHTPMYPGGEIRGQIYLK
jgi:hypothetical protein